MASRLRRLAGTALAVGAMNARLARRRRADAHFFDPSEHLAGPYPGLHHDFFLPMHYHDNTSFVGVFPASAEAIAGVLPSDDLFPVLLPDGRGAVAVGAFMYHHVFWHDAARLTHEAVPYGEVGVFALCTFGRPAPRGIPLLQPAAPQHWQLGAFDLHMPVTAREHMVGGREAYNAPKFVADMHFVEDPTFRQVRIFEDDRHLLTMRVGRRGPAVTDRRSQIWFTSRNGHLMRTHDRVHGMRQTLLGPRSGHLEFGDHPVATELRELEVASRPVAAFQYVAHDMVLPNPEAVGPARDYDGYRGSDVEFGRWTVTYAGSEPIDVYETLRHPETILLEEPAHSPA